MVELTALQTRAAEIYWQKRFIQTFKASYLSGSLGACDRIGFERAARRLLGVKER